VSPQDAAGLSDQLFFAAVVLYALAMLAFSGEQASRRSFRVSERAARTGSADDLSARERTLAMGQRATGSSAGGVGASSTAVADRPQRSGPSGSGGPGVSRAGRIGLLFTVVGAGLHLGSVVSRGYAAGRVPWGNMYEFSSMVALLAVGIFLTLVATGRLERSLGAFVMVPVVLYLGLAGTVLYTAAGPLVPALDSYWIKIHVFAAILATASFLFSGVLALLYLARARFDRSAAPRFPLSVAAALPAAKALDRVSYAVIAFAFPIWTFAIIAGAIWAEAAWGRYWGWDPKETWSFITWVLYAGYLHARATAGWKGSKAAWIAVAAAVALIIDYYVVNIFVVGLHSYA